MTHRETYASGLLIMEIEEAIHQLKSPFSAKALNGSRENL